MKLFLSFAFVAFAVAKAAEDGGYDCGSNNPCTDENIAAGNLYFASTDPQYFVQCDAHGGCYVMPCGPGTVWNQELQTCDHAPAEEGEPACTDGPVENDVVCENRGWAFLACRGDTTIHIQSANYGRTEPSRDVCRYFWFHKDKTDCVDDTTAEKVRHRCEGKEWCAVPAANYFFGDTCPGTYKYLSITYQCVCARPETFDCDDNNPCSAESIAEANSFYFPHHEETNFVQCDNHGSCFVMPCAPGTKWNDEAKTCIHA